MAMHRKSNVNSPSHIFALNGLRPKILCAMSAPSPRSTERGSVKARP